MQMTLSFIWLPIALIHFHQGLSYLAYMILAQSWLTLNANKTETLVVGSNIALSKVRDYSYYRWLVFQGKEC